MYSFTGGDDGANPVGVVIADKTGNLYGTTAFGGAYANGVVFKLAPDGTETVLYSFTGSSDGALPFAGVIMDQSGNLYGTTLEGGDYGAGNIFEVTPNGSETTLYSFTCQSDGCLPNAGLTEDKSGNFYGTTWYGGANFDGNVYKLAPDGTLTTLYSFAGGNDGFEPYAGVIFDKAGNLYGATAYGGGTGCLGSGCGTVFKLTPGGTETVLYAFTGGSDGAGPQANLYMDKKGNLYGTTMQGGSGCDYGCGTVFEVSAGGVESTVHTFTQSEGADSTSSLVADSKGDLFGTTQFAGTYGYGSVFKIKE